MRTARVLVARATGLLLALCAGVLADAREFRSSDIYPLDYPTVQAVVQVDRLMRERSSGKLGMTVLGYDDRDSEHHTAAQVRNGQLDMARINLAVLSNIAPTTPVFALPYLFTSKEQTRRVLDGQIGEEILAGLEAQGLIGLCFYDGGPRHMYGKKPIRTPADMNGLRARVQQADSWAGMFRAVGADPVVVPHDRIYLALQSGAIDVAENNWPYYVSQRHYQVAPYLSITGHSMAPTVLVFSKRVWDTLKPDEQAIIRSAAKESVPLMRQLWDASEAAGRRTVEAAGGVVVTDVDRKAFAERFMPLHTTVIDNDQLRSLVRRVQAHEPVEPSERPRD